MKRALFVLLLAALVVAPAASAKGAHAILTTPRETVEPGKPWQVTVELNEFRRPPVPAMIGRRGARTVGAEAEKVPASMDAAAGFRFTMVFPREGHWKLRLFAGNRRFAFPAVAVGGAAMPQNYVAFPVGSEADRAGGSGVWTTDEAPAAPAGRGQTPLEEGSDPSEGGSGGWLLALFGVALASAGVAVVTRRGSRRERRPPTGAPRQPSEG
jgi:hypothetical protein